MLLRSTLPVALLLLISTAAAQAPAPLFDLHVLVPSEPLADAAVGEVKLTVERTCPMAVSILAAQSARIKVHSGWELKVAGPATALFDQQVCASTPTQFVELVYQVSLDEQAARGASYQATILLEPEPAGTPPVMQYGNSAQADFLVASATPVEPVAEEAAPTEQEAPAPAAAVLVMGLLAAVAIVRRRA